MHIIDEAWIKAIGFYWNKVEKREVNSQRNPGYMQNSVSGEIALCDLEESENGQM